MSFSSSFAATPRKTYSPRMTQVAALPFLPRIIPNDILGNMPETPEGLDEAYKPVPLNMQLKAADSLFLAQIAAYRNALATAQGLRFERNWSRKSLAEAFITAACKELRREITPILRACGPMPELDLDEAKSAAEKARFRKSMSAYAKKVLDWQAREKSRSEKK